MYTSASYQQPQLPFNPQQITGPWLNLNIQNPPFVPRLAVVPQLQNYVPLIAAIAAMEIQNNAQKNNLRTFMFNQHSVNNYANEDFASLVAAAVDYVALVMARGQYGNIELAIQESVPKIVEMLCAMNLRVFPGLEAFTDPNSQQAARVMVGHFDTIAQEIGMMKRQSQQVVQQPQWQQQPQFGGGRPGWAQPAQQGWGQQPPLAQPSMGSSTLFSGRGPVTTGTVDPGERAPMRGRFEEAVVRQPFTPRQPEETSVQQEPLPEAHPLTEAPAPEEVLASSGKLKWKPSAELPYFPAYDTSKYVLFLKKRADGSTEPVFKERNSVDYNQHALTSVFGPVPKTLDLSGQAATLERIQEGVRKINSPELDQPEAAEGEQAADLPPVTTYVKKAWLAETSEASAWLIGGLERLRNPQGVPDVFRVYAQIAEPVVSMTDETSVVGNYASSNTFIELREKLNASVNDVSAGLWGAANGRMTKAVNRIIKQNLGIPSLWIESFVADIEDLIQLLGSKYGDSILGAFLKHQRMHIKRAFGTLGEGTARDIADSLVDQSDYAEGNLPKITYLASNYTFTLLNCRAHELNIELSADSAAAVTESFAPLMHSLLKGLFEAAESEGEFDRHLIRTNDGRVLEAARGYIGQDFFLLSLIE